MKVLVELKTGKLFRHESQPVDASDGIGDDKSSIRGLRNIETPVFSFHIMNRKRFL